MSREGFFMLGWGEYWDKRRVKSVIGDLKRVEMNGFWGSMEM